MTVDPGLWEDVPLDLYPSTEVAPEDAPAPERPTTPWDALPYGHHVTAIVHTAKATDSTVTGAVPTESATGALIALYHGLGLPDTARLYDALEAVIGHVWRTPGGDVWPLRQAAHRACLWVSAAHLDVDRAAVVRALEALALFPAMADTAHHILTDLTETEEP